jgi:hypothetical protein
MTIEVVPFNTDTQINARITLPEKLALIALAKAKGAKGITGLLKLLAKAKEVRITL